MYGRRSSKKRGGFKKSGAKSKGFLVATGDMWFAASESEKKRIRAMENALKKGKGRAALAKAGKGKGVVARAAKYAAKRLGR